MKSLVNLDRKASFRSESAVFSCISRGTKDLWWVCKVNFRPLKKTCQLALIGAIFAMCWVQALAVEGDGSPWLVVHGLCWRPCSTGPGQTRTDAAVWRSWGGQSWHYWKPSHCFRLSRTWHVRQRKFFHRLALLTDIFLSRLFWSDSLFLYPEFKPEICLQGNAAGETCNVSHSKNFARNNNNSADFHKKIYKSKNRMDIEFRYDEKLRMQQGMHEQVLKSRSVGEFLSYIQNWTKIRKTF